MKVEEKLIVNQKLIYAWLAIQFCHVLGTVMAWFSGTALWSIVPFTLVAIVAPVYCMVKRRTLLYMEYVVAICLAIQIMLVYFIFLTPIVYVYGLLTMLLLTLYENKKLTIGFSFVMSIEILFCFYWDKTYVGMFDVTNSSIGLFSVLSGFVVTLVVMITVKAVADHRKHAVEQEAANTDKVYNSLLKRNEQIQGSMHDVLERLKYELDNTTSINAAIAEVTTALGTIAESLQTQSTETSALREEVMDIKQCTLGLSDTQSVCINAVSDGVVVLEQTRNAANTVQESSTDVLRCVEALMKRVLEVRKVISIISDISDKTQLLSINASIEAAHAGASGAGFSVVADEIKHLASTTKEAIESITGYLTELEDYTNNVVVKANAIDVKILEQTEQLNNVEAAFCQIREATEQLTPVIDTVIQKVSNTAKANDSLVEEITMVSATSEEVSASAETVTGLSDGAVAELNEITKIVSEVMEERE